VDGTAQLNARRVGQAQLLEDLINLDFDAVIE
jgi:hypothetical protein